jgi:hypothetical protein
MIVQECCLERVHPNIYTMIGVGISLGEDSLGEGGLSQLEDE